MDIIALLIPNKSGRTIKLSSPGSLPKVKNCFPLRYIPCVAFYQYKNVLSKDTSSLTQANTHSNPMVFLFCKKKILVEEH